MQILCGKAFGFLPQGIDFFQGQLVLAETRFFCQLRCRLADFPVEARQFLQVAVNFQRGLIGIRIGKPFLPEPPRHTAADDCGADHDKNQQ